MENMLNVGDIIIGNGRVPISYTIERVTPTQAVSGNVKVKRCYSHPEHIKPCGDSGYFCDYRLHKAAEGGEK